MSGPEIQRVMAELAQMTDPRELKYLRGVLSGVAQLPAAEAHPLDDYLRLLSDISKNMLEIDAKLNDTRASLRSGNAKQALADLEQLKKLRDQTRVLFSSSYALLDQVAAYYQVDTTTQVKKTAELEADFQTYANQIDQLDQQVGTQQGLIQTTLTLNASRSEIFINETLPIYGFLRVQNVSALEGRNVTISWGANQTTVKTSAEGKFETDIRFPIGFPAGSTLVEARFEPSGSDSERYLSSKSLLEIKVAYYPSSIEADIYPHNARRSDLVTALGRLSSRGGLPLESRTVVFRLDGTSLGNSTTNSTGWFRFGFIVPADVSNGTHFVIAAFTASGEPWLAPSNMTLPLTVEVGMYTVQGYVLAPDGSTSVPGCWVSIYEPASNASIGSWTDERGYYSFSSANGTFVFDVSPPSTLSTSLSYAHYQEANFTVPSDISKNIILTYGTQIAMRMDRASLLSGMELTVEGTVKLTNATLWKYGHVSIFFDSFYYSSATVEEDGSFLSHIQLPMSVGFGSHTVKVEYHPDEAWVKGSEVAAQVFIYNIGAVIFAALAILAASSLGVYRITRSRQAAGLVPSALPEPVAVEEGLFKAEYSPESLTYAIEAERDHASKVRRCYRLAQALIDQKLGEPAAGSETHWEYFRRVKTAVPAVEHSLKRLVELFELAEYSPYPIGSGESREATDILLKLRQDVGESYVESPQEYAA